MASTVADIYRVVDTAVRSHTPPARMVLSVWLSALILGVWSAPELRAYVLTHDDLPLSDQVLAGALLVEQGATSAGVLAARERIDELVQPLKRPPRILGRAPAPVALEAVPQVGPDAEPVARADTLVLPGERWVGPADLGGERIERVLIVGASSIQYYVGTELERAMEERYAELSVHRLGKLGTGLVRDDVFDWPAEIARLMEAHRPQLVVAQFGGNDAQPMLVDGARVAVGTPAWDTAYSQRLQDLTRQIQGGGALPVFVGMPVMRDAGFTGRIERLNGVTQRAVQGAGGRYVSTWDLAANPDGSYRVQVEVDGRRSLMRLEDGIHFSRPGAKYMATELMTRLEQHAPLVPADDRAVAVHQRIDSAARGRAIPHLAFVPRDVPPEGLPVLVLLHGAWGGWTDWSNHAHETLRALATEHRVILVLADGDPFGWYLDSDRVDGARVHTYLVDELLPAVQRRLPVQGGHVGMMGLSMGGHGAILTGLLRPELLRSASSISGALDLAHARSRKQLQERLGPYGDNAEDWHRWSVLHQLRRDPEPARDLALKITCGTQDKVWLESNRAVYRTLVSAGIEHDYTEVPGGHTWEVWTAALPDHVAWHAAQLHGDSL